MGRDQIITPSMRRKITSKKLKNKKPLIDKALYVGLDLSLSSTGYAILSKDLQVCVTGTIGSSPPTKIEERILQIWNSIVSEILLPHTKSIKVIGIEDIAFAARGQRIAQLSGLHFFVRTMLLYSFPQINQFIVSASTIKKYVTGKGNASKSIMLLHCYKKFNFSTDSDDVCDAYCLARYLINKQ